jgi:tRNA(Ile)-lysidine synthase
MRTSLEQAVLKTVQDERMMAPGDRVGMAVSGGADSVALFRLLLNLREELGINLLVVHFDHSLRGAESDADAQFVAELSRAFGLEFLIQRADVAAEAKKQGLNLEDAARRLRYGFFERTCASGKAARIAVAHTADDQAETVLAHIIRGTGPTGLGGIYPVAGSIIRPLLGTRREDLRDFLIANGQAWREDSTNSDTQRLRARVRERLLPLLQNDFSPAIVSQLENLAQLAREEAVFWDSFIENLFRAHVRKNDEGFAIRVADLLSPYVLADQSAVNSNPNSNITKALRPLTERFIRRLYKSIRGDCKELTHLHVEQVIRLAAESTSGRHLQLPGDIRVEKRFGDLIFSHGDLTKISSGMHLAPAQSRTYRHVVSLPQTGVATVSIPELGRRFCLKVVDWTLQPSDTKRDGQALDADLLRKPLILRNWRSGDAYRPRGRRRLQKLKEMFQVQRVPLGERAGWPVLETEGRVIWTRGMHPADDFCAKENTRVAVFIEERQNESAEVLSAHG